MNLQRAGALLGKYCKSREKKRYAACKIEFCRYKQGRCNHEIRKGT